MPKSPRTYTLLKPQEAALPKKVTEVLREKIMFYNQVEFAIKNAQRKASALAVFCINLDESGLTANGHEADSAAGKDILEDAEKRISGILKRSGIALRTGPDECLVLIQNLKDIDAAHAAAGKIQEALTQAFEASAQKSPYPAGIGVAIYPIDAGDAKTLICHANAAAYRARQGGGSKVSFYSNASNVEIQDELELTSDIYHALDRGELEMYYQPQVDSRTNKIVGLEALLRWHHPKKGDVVPMKFIPIAEKTGLILKIGKWTLKAACAQNKYWQDLGLRKIPIAVNLSARQFEHEDMAKIVEEILAETKLQAEYLVLEITESTAFRELTNVAEMLKRLKMLGVRIAVDDFGTAYSALSYIKRLPVDAIKIDKCFVHGIGESTVDEAIIKAVIDLIQNLNMSAIAEGVETKRQADFLAQAGCHVLQGFYYAKPMPAAYIGELLSKDSAPVGSEAIAIETASATIINSYLDQMGVRHAHAGYGYLFKAISFGIEDSSLLRKISELYKKIAELDDIKPSNVERAIRYSIIHSGFTVKEFILRAVDNIKYSKYS